MNKNRIVSVLVSALVLASWGAASAQADHHAKAKSIKAKSIKTSTPIAVAPRIDIDTKTVVSLVDTRTAVLRIDTSTVVTHFDTGTAIGHEAGEVEEAGEIGEHDGKGDDDTHSATTLPTLGAKSLPANSAVASPRNQEFNKKSGEKHKS